LASAASDAGDIQTVPAMVLRSAERFGAAPALDDGVRELSFADDAEEMLISRALMARDVQRSDRILWAPNTASWITSARGFPAADGWLVPLDTLFKVEKRPPT
jgi:HIP---CoA ligase